MKKFKKSFYKFNNQKVFYFNIKFNRNKLNFQNYKFEIWV